MSDLDGVITAALDGAELEYETYGPGDFVVKLPGTRKLATMCKLVVGAHALQVEAFVMRQPDENHQQLYAFLLERNAKQYGVAFSIDKIGDVYLTGRVSLSSVTAEELDRLLGAVLTYADENFNSMLEIGFGTSIRREWEWRVKRGEPLDNLKAFARFADPSA